MSESTAEWEWQQPTAGELSLGLWKRAVTEGRGEMVAVRAATGGGSRESHLGTKDTVCARDNCKLFP